MLTCDQLMDQIAELGQVVALEDDAARAHFDGCSGCRALSAALLKVDRDLRMLSTEDAPQSIVTATLDRITTEVPATVVAPVAGRVQRSSRLRVPGWLLTSVGKAAAAIVVLSVGIGLVARWSSRDSNNYDAALLRVEEPQSNSDDSLMVSPSQSAPDLNAATSGETDEFGADVANEQVARLRDQKRPSQERNYRTNPPLAPPPSVVGGLRADKLERQIGGKDDSLPKQQATAGYGDREASAQSFRNQIDSIDVYAQQRTRAPSRGKGRAEKEKKAEEFAHKRQIASDELDRDQGMAAPMPSSLPEGWSGDVRDLTEAARLRPNSVRPSAVGRVAGTETPIDSAVTFQEASGYWSNTYIPGDPTIRVLESRLLRNDNPPVTGPDGKPLRLDSASRQYRQPFDPPSNAALAVYLHSDRLGIAGESRFLVQVGLQGTNRASGLRPAMNVGVILDLTAGVSSEVGASMRALLTALDDAQQTGDRFSLTIAGAPGGVALRTSEFRHGAIAVLTRQLFGADEAITAPTLSRDEALAAAALEVAQANDPTAQLGASVMMLVTAGAIPEFELSELEEAAHRGAVGGIPLSVVGVGSAIDIDQLDRLTLAGQGSRRLLTSALEAAPLVDRELHSSSQVVARAVRLRIRLAPGVKLVEVIGSGKLEDGGAARVREAELSIDRRIAKNLGIEADRGEDEEGIQMVIPAYYAGDAHVVLLDVVAPRPGAIADVTVRYKDLVFLRNGVAQANLSLTSRRDDPGPLEHNVTKNLIAMRLSAAIREAGLMLEQGDRERADAILAEQVRVLAELRAGVPGWANDPELHNDGQMLAEYRTAIAGALTDDQRLSDSLRYAGHLKVQARRR